MRKQMGVLLARQRELQDILEQGRGDKDVYSVFVISSSFIAF